MVDSDYRAPAGRYVASVSTPSVPTSISADAVISAPKVVLHDHLDGGVRPQTVIDLAQTDGYDALPSTDADKLGQWFRDSANSGSLVRYLETFAHTVGVMQTADAITRVAREAAEDFADDGVVYAEIRWAPEQHVEARHLARAGHGCRTGRFPAG